MKTNKDILKELSIALLLTLFASVVIVINMHRSLNGCHKVVYFDYVALGLTRLACEVK